MSERPLEGKKIAVLVESEYIPEEILAYREHFGRLGAQVDEMSRLWGQPQLKFHSTKDTDMPGKLDELEVKIDFDHVNVHEYAAVLMAANYTSVRLRYFEQGDNPRVAPAVQFFARAMSNPAIVKGALCHGLWILTPLPELLHQRTVTCHRVMLADVLNCGARFQDDPSGVVVDDDLVTGKSKHEATDVKTPAGLPPYIQAIVDQILKRTGGVPPPSWTPAELQKVKLQGRRRILIVLSEHGYWGEELVGPLDVFDAAGYVTTFATANGKRPAALPPSMSAGFVDPALGRSVTSAEVARKTRELDDTGPDRTARSRRLDNPVSLAATLPEMPYWCVPGYLRQMEAYYRVRQQVWDTFVADFNALLIVGGSGPIIDLVNNQRVHDLILGFYNQDKPIAAECYGVPCLAFAREIDNRKSIIWGKHVTGHCREYDWKDGTGFLGTDLNMGPPPYPLEYILRDATGSSGGFHGNVGHETSVMVDYPFITGRSTPDAYLTGQKLVEVLEMGLRKFGWGPAEYAR
jgi:putative intracellular protease/amidase